MVNGIDTLWLLFSAFYFVFLLMGLGLTVLFLLKFRPTARMIEKVFNAEIDWN